MEQTRNEDDAKVKNTRDETPKKGGFKKTKTEFHQEKLTTEIFEYFGQKNRYGDEEEHGEEEV